MNKASAVISTTIMAAVSNKATAAVTTATTIIMAAVSNKATAAKTRAGTTQRTKKRILTVTVSVIVGLSEIG